MTLEIITEERPSNLEEDRAFKLCDPVPLVTFIWKEPSKKDGKDKVLRRHVVMLQYRDEESGELFFPTAVFIRDWEWEELQRQLELRKKHPLYKFDPSDLDDWFGMQTGPGEMQVFPVSQG